MKKSISTFAIAAALAVCPVSMAQAQDAYPSRPITMVVPYAAGGSADVMGRVLAQQLGEELGQTVIVDLKGGGGTVIGTQIVAKNAKPDGYTILLGANPLAINAALMRLPYDAGKDLTPVAGVLGFPSVLVTRADAPYKTVQDVVQASKSGALPYGSSGQGTHSHMSGELFAVLTGAELVHVPYKGSGAVYPDLMAGRVALLFDVSASAVSFINGGKVKALGVTSTVRSKALPNVPTLIEQGVKGYENLTWFALFAPRDTPLAVVNRLNAAVNKVIASPSFTEQVDKWGGLVLPGVKTPDDLSKLLRDDTERWGRLVREGRVKPLN
jgi:tripartite-type tricarboxylate transporter receptor subunit TctC